MIKITKWYFAVVLLVFLFLPIIAYTAAGVPLIFSYQGRLTNSSGSLLTGTYYFKFSIWDNPTSNPSTGNKLWPSGNPTEVSATVTSGVFNVNIGDTDNGYPDALNYNFNTNKDIYLEVKVSSSSGGSFETLSPRQRISSAPFAQLSGAVSGTGQSSFGTTTPASAAIVTVTATTTSAIPVLIRAFAAQVANLFRIEDSSSNPLFVVDKSGNVGIGTSTPSRKFDVLGVDSVPQLRLSQTGGSVYGELYVVPTTGDIQISSTGGNIRNQNENLWICKDGSCATSDPVDKGNIVLENQFIFDNGFTFRQTSASTTMYNASGTPILQFDNGQ